MLADRRSPFLPLITLVAPALWLALVGPGQAEEIRADAMRIPVVVGGKTVELEALVVRPDDSAAHPLAIVNHGSPRDAGDRAAMHPTGMWTQASALARRGWVGVAFMRRGYGASGGDWAEAYGTCANPDYVDAGRAGAEDIAGVAAAMERQSYVAKGRWISIGTSAGAFATVALTAQAPAGLAAAIAFAPGRGSTSADKVCGDNKLAEAFAAYGRTSRTPLLWVNAANDHFFGPALATRFIQGFEQAGGRATHVPVAAFGADGHLMFGAQGKAVWAPILDKFLADNQLKLRERPIETTPPGSLDPRGRQAFESYLDSAPNKSFAVGPGTKFGWATGRDTTEKSRADALAFCASGGDASRCHVVNVNERPAQ